MCTILVLPQRSGTVLTTDTLQEHHNFYCKDMSALHLAELWLHADDIVPYCVRDTFLL